MDLKKTEDICGNVNFECSDGAIFEWHKASNSGTRYDKYGSPKSLGFTGENGVCNAAVRHECNSLIGEVPRGTIKDVGP